MGCPSDGPLLNPGSALATHVLSDKVPRPRTLLSTREGRGQSEAWKQLVMPAVPTRPHGAPQQPFPAP